MLTPDELEQAGELVAAVYTDIEAEMLAYLVRKMIEGNVAGQRSQTALLLLAQSAAPELHRILDERGGEIDRAVRKEVSVALRRSDEADLAYIKKGLGVELPKVTNRQIAATVAGVEEILGRHNLQMEDAAREAFVKASAEAVTMVNAGTMTTEQALHRAVRKLERDGISVIQYQNAQTGAATVANKVDVAVRRHVRTQIAQDGARLTELRMDEAGIDFVEVSSHTGARPSHQEWEGRVYSRKGTKTVGGVTYQDFYTACHWGDVADGIYGANCRHSHGPYIPGMPRTYSPDPRHPSGLTNDEVYELNQEQRAMERRIRETKRELKGCELLYESNRSDSNLAEVLRAKERLRENQTRLRSFIDEANSRCIPGTSVLQRSPRREWAGDMPKVNLAASAQAKHRALAMAAVKDRCVRKLYPIFAEDDFGKVARAAWGKLPRDAFFNVAMHGTPVTVELFGARADHEALAEILRRRSDYTEGQPVRLLSCSTGADIGQDSACFAQRLANELGVDVVAPTDKVWISTDGSIEVGEDWGDNTGIMKPFHPRPRWQRSTLRNTGAEAR